MGLKYNYLSVPHISASATLSAPLHIADSNSEILRSVSIGVPIVFYNSLMAGGILNNLLTINMRPDVAAKLDFEWWYGIQAYDKLWLDLTSSFGTVVLKNQKNIGGFESKPFWEKFPITLGATYAVNHYFDLGANVGFEDIFEDIRKAKNTFKFGLTFTTRAGRLFG